MIDIELHPLQALIIGGFCFGLAALIISILTYRAARRNCRIIKTTGQDIKQLLAAQEKEDEYQANIKAFLERALRELEHDHDKFKDTLEGYSQTLARIENVAQQVKENQHTYLIKNNSHTGSSNNKIKVNTQKEPAVYEGQLVNTLLSQLIDRIQQQPPPKDH